MKDRITREEYIEALISKGYIPKASYKAWKRAEILEFVNTRIPNEERAMLFDGKPRERHEVAFTKKFINGQAHKHKEIERKTEDVYKSNSLMTLLRTQSRKQILSKLDMPYYGEDELQDVVKEINRLWG